MSLWQKMLKSSVLGRRETCLPKVIPYPNIVFIQFSINCIGLKKSLPIVVYSRDPNEYHVTIIDNSKLRTIDVELFCVTELLANHAV